MASDDEPASRPALAVTLAALDATSVRFTIRLLATGEAAAEGKTEVEEEEEEEEDQQKTQSKDEAASTLDFSLKQWQRAMESPTRTLMRHPGSGAASGGQLGSGSPERVKWGRGRKLKQWLGQAQHAVASLRAQAEAGDALWLRELAMGQMLLAELESGPGVALASRHQPPSPPKALTPEKRRLTSSTSATEPSQPDAMVATVVAGGGATTRVVRARVSVEPGGAGAVGARVALRLQVSVAREEAREAAALHAVRAAYSTALREVAARQTALQEHAAAQVRAEQEVQAAAEAKEREAIEAAMRRAGALQASLLASERARAAKDELLRAEASWLREVDKRQRGPTEEERRQEQEQFASQMVRITLEATLQFDKWEGTSTEEEEQEERGGEDGNKERRGGGGLQLAAAAERADDIAGPLSRTEAVTGEPMKPDELEAKPAVMLEQQPDGWFLKSPLDLPLPRSEEPELVERSVAAAPQLVVVEEYGGLRLSTKSKLDQ